MRLFVSGFFREKHFFILNSMWCGTAAEELRGRAWEKNGIEMLQEKTGKAGWGALGPGLQPPYIHPHFQGHLISQPYLLGSGGGEGLSAFLVTINHFSICPFKIPSWSHKFLMAWKGTLFCPTYFCIKEDLETLSCKRHKRKQLSQLQHLTIRTYLTLLLLEHKVLHGGGIYSSPCLNNISCQMAFMAFHRHQASGKQWVAT